MVIFGVFNFYKPLGYYGEECVCSKCSSKYKSELLRWRAFFHISLIPLIPLGSNYIRVCPRCLNSVNITKKEAKELLSHPDTTNQNFITYAKHKKDNNIYEIWTKDTVNGIETCAINNLNKGLFKDYKKGLGLKNINVIEE